MDSAVALPTVPQRQNNQNAASRRIAPFQWVANPDEIIAAVRRGHQVLDSIH